MILSISIIAFNGREPELRLCWKRPPAASQLFISFGYRGPQLVAVHIEIIKRFGKITCPLAVLGGPLNVPKDGFRFPRNYYIMPVDDTQGSFLQLQQSDKWGCFSGWLACGKGGSSERNNWKHRAARPEWTTGCAGILNGMTLLSLMTVYRNCFEGRYIHDRGYFQRIKDVFVLHSMSKCIDTLCFLNSFTIIILQLVRDFCVNYMGDW